MNEMQQEIVRLSNIWMRFVGVDHHKDRDCHWYIQKYYSYGEKPYYMAWHHGYIGDDFEGSKCITLEEAEEELLNAIKFQIHKAKKWVSRNLEEVKELEAKDDDEPFFGSSEEYERMINILNEA
jgi:hypothetical protein